MKGRSKTGRIEGRKKSVKGAVIREFVKEVVELKRKGNNSDNDDGEAKTNKNDVVESYDALSRFKNKK